MRAPPWCIALAAALLLLLAGFQLRWLSAPGQGFESLPRESAGGWPAGFVPPRADSYYLPRGAGQLALADEVPSACDGRRDDTDDIIRLVQQSQSNRSTGRRILQLPNRRCTIRDRIAWSSADGEWLQGLSIVGSGPYSELRLIDHAPGFQDPAAPRAVLYLASQQAPGDPPSWQLDGSGNKAFHNHVRDLIIHTGRGNPGAICIDALQNNVGAIRRVRCISGDGEGYAGINLERYGPGPALIADSSIRGFDYAIRAKPFDYAVTLQNLTIERQRRAGIYTGQLSLAIEGLHSFNRVPAIQTASAAAHVVLVDSRLEGGSRETAAVVGPGRLLVRNLRSTGYASAIEGRSGAHVAEFSSEPTVAAFGEDARRTLELPVPPVPVAFHSSNPADWADVRSYGGVPGDERDDTEALRRALHSGKPIVYAGGLGDYLLSEPISIPASVKTIDFMSRTLRLPHGAPLPERFFIVAQNSAEPLTLRRFWLRGIASSIGIAQDSTRALLIEDATVGGRMLIGPHRGDVFISDATARPEIGPGSRLFAWQLNPESERAEQLVLNDGGLLRVLGLKSEGPSRVVVTRNGGLTEVLGGLLYPVWAFADDLPAFVFEDSCGSVSYAETAYEESRAYATHLIETRGGATRRLQRSELPRRGLARAVALGSAHSPACRH